MLTIPFQVSETEYSIFVVLENDNLDRLKAYDPAEIVLTKFPPAWQALKLKVVVIGYATPEEAARLQDPKADTRALLRQLCRGFAFRPDRGDTNARYKEV